MSVEPFANPVTFASSTALFTNSCETSGVKVIRFHAWATASGAKSDRVSSFNSSIRSFCASASFALIPLGQLRIRRGDLLGHVGIFFQELSAGDKPGGDHIAFFYKHAPFCLPLQPGHPGLDGPDSLNAARLKELG